MNHRSKKQSSSRNGGIGERQSSGSSLRRRSYRQGQEAYEQQLQEEEQQKGRRQSSSVDPPAALDPNELPPSPTYKKRVARSKAAAAAAPAGHNAIRKIQDFHLYDDPTPYGTYNVPTFKEESRSNRSNDELPYTWDDVVKEAERRKSHQNSNHSVSSSRHYFSPDVSPTSAKSEEVNPKRSPQQSLSVTNSPTSLKRRINAEYRPKSTGSKTEQSWEGYSNLNCNGEISNNYRPLAFTAPPLPFQDNDQLPSLPLVQTFKVTKLQPSQPAGLFLTKAKNGAVLVHSLTSTSIFRCNNDNNNTGDNDTLEENRRILHPGQEVLSVNEKRVNDPKMAASLISQAKGRLSLRVSTVERHRGFLYCQVKRRLGRGANNNNHHQHRNKHTRDHGIRFATTSVDGVRRGTVTDGLVRVAHIEPDGLFASLHPLNRLRLSSIVLTVNGTPVSNGRVALEKIMESRHLIEVLHCDERVWREEWTLAGLCKVLFGGRHGSEGHVISNSADGDIIEESAYTILTKKDDIKRHGQYKLIDQFWDLSWTFEHNEVTISKVGSSSCAFKLKFNDKVGTCQCELINGKMMPTTEDLDVSSFVKVVNNSQKEMMLLLQSMLQRGKLESNFLGGGLPSGTALSSVCYGDGLTRVERIQSVVGLEEMIKDEDGVMDGEQEKIADDTKIGVKKDPCKRRSTGALADEPYEEFLQEELEMLHLHESANTISSSGDRVRDFSARRHQMEERQHCSSERQLHFSSKSSNGSMFSADLLEEFVNDLDHDFSASDSVGSTATNATHSFDESDRSNSPKDSTSVLDESAMSPLDTSFTSETTSLDDDNAYITGVWRDVYSKYEISDNVLGSGGFGEVKDCYDKNTGKVYVVKTIFKPPAGDTVKINLIRNEILLLHEANHPNIVELKDLFEDSSYVHIVMERCAGGDLFDRVVEENPRRIRSISEGMKHEATTANAMRSIIHVVRYLHSKNICHRDIKPEHFLLTTNERETQKIKLIDFGLARKHNPGSEPMSTFTGSPSFVAPEVIDRSYDHMCDCWSTGVTAYFLLTGMLPFDGQNDEETFQIISSGEFSFPASSIFLSSDAKDFVAKLLVKDPRRRMTASEALNHPWLQKTATC